MLAIAVNALYTALRKRGTTRQLAGTIVACVVSALLLLPALFWYEARFSSSQVTISVVELTFVLSLVALCGWILPLGATTGYCLFALPRDSNTSMRIPRQLNYRKRTTLGNVIGRQVVLPKREPGVLAPFVFGEGIPWGWLEHRSGRFQGQKLALNRSVISIGREEDNDIWLDDETSSRYHAELVWDNGQAYITDCNSLNGVLLNGRRIRGTLVIKSGDLVEIGSHRFIFEIAERPTPLVEQDDPLLPHLRRLSVSPETGFQDEGRKLARALAAPTMPIDHETPLEFDSLELNQPAMQLPRSTPGEINIEISNAEIMQNGQGSNPITPPVIAERPGSLCTIWNGAMAGRSFFLDRPELTIGSSTECDVIILDHSVASQHVKFMCQLEGDYIQALNDQYTTEVNGVKLVGSLLLRKGDIVGLGNIRMEYTFIPEAHTSALPPLPISVSVYPQLGPGPLRLPSKRK
ncbi:MAG TPA: FHA domain-containing protein [Ktedonobacteraceae bacterium]|nr:FHA domain-containing protein [Ktedonobacteraceae bacterium]